MLDERILNDIAQGAGNIAANLYSDIMKRIITRLCARLTELGHAQFTGTDKWQVETLTEAGYLLDDIQKDIAKATKLQEIEIAQTMQYAGIKSFEADSQTYIDAGIIAPDEVIILPTGEIFTVPAADITQHPQYLNIMQRGYEKTMGTWRNFTGTTANNAHQTFIQECDRAYNLVMSNAVSYTEVYTEAINRMVQNGLHVHYNAAGRPHRDTIETATLRAVRTGTAQACGDVSLQRMEDLNWDIVLVDAHMGARTANGNTAANHAWWQGKFYSRSGRTSGMPPFDVCGYGTGEGLCGYNCRHSFAPGDGKHNPFAGMINSAANQRAYEVSQRQRELERRIRRTKGDVMAYEQAVKSSSGAAKEKLQHQYERSAAKLQKQNERYNVFCNTHNLHRYDDRLKVAKWDRSKAAKATQAANRWRKEHS